VLLEFQFISKLH